MSERKRELAEEASSTSFSPLKKTKLNDSSDSSPDSHDVIVFAVSSSSVASSAALASDECSVTIAGEESDQSSSISSGCFTSESKEIAKNSSSFGVDLEDHQIETETETSTFITSNFRFIIFLFPPPPPPKLDVQSILFSLAIFSLFFMAEKRRVQ
ncbi:Cyclin-dependent kinase inhibitor [Arabidopsis suecica]|uniref:Cyclin-dependent kinase inhibitor n=1 Tax=Arabidopsis suecica TaxID=45249 RepID=A0A8T2F6J9_ARASU|nr:Cyclin-dependent kinase inhibitor [Arabidopsis suecica]